MRVTTGDGVQLAVRDYDPPSRTQTVVFLHGFCLSRASWARQIDDLLGRYGDSTRIIAYDHRGHGDSSAAPMGTYRIDRLAADLDEVLAALDVTAPLTLVGHSMGAMAIRQAMTIGAKAYAGGVAQAGNASEVSGSRMMVTAKQIAARRNVTCPVDDRGLWDDMTEPLHVGVVGANPNSRWGQGFPHLGADAEGRCVHEADRSRYSRRHWRRSTLSSPPRVALER